MSTLVEVEAAIHSLPELEQRALYERLAMRMTAKEGSCFDLVQDMFDDPSQLGESGLRDLSTNRVHLEDFGR